MATKNGPWQSRARIEWSYSIGAISPGATTVRVEVEAYLRMDQYASIAGTYPKYWSGEWGSGSANQSFNLGPNARVLVVSSGLNVALTDSARNISFGASVSHYHGSTGDTLTVSIGAKKYNAPAAPSTPAHTRVSDTSQTVTWNRAATAAAPYTSQQLQRQELVNGVWSAWAGINTINTTYTNAGAHSVTDSSTKKNGQYQYRVKASNSAGEKYSSTSLLLFTTPDAPSAVLATKLSNTSIQIDITPGQTNPLVRQSLQYRVGTGAWTNLVDLGAGVLTYTWNSVPAGSSIVFRSRAVVNSTGSTGNGLLSGYKESNVVPLTAPPNPATNLSPNGVALNMAVSQKFSWRHNQADSSAQTAYEIQYKTTTGSYVSTGKILSSTQSHTMAANTLLNGSNYDWQVRTWGVHANPSAWSTVATLVASAPPSVTITGPSSILAASLLTVKWTFSDPEGSAQSLWEASLLLDGSIIESKSGSGNARQTSFTTRLQDATEYQVKVRGRDGSGLWSAEDRVTFTTDFPLPIKPEINAQFDHEAGVVQIPTRNWEGVTPWTVKATNLAPPIVGSGVWAEVRRNLAKSPIAEEGLANGAWLPNWGSGAGTQIFRSTWGTGIRPITQMTWTTAAASNGYLQFARHGSHIPVSPGDVLDVSMDAFANVPTRVTVEWYTAAGVFLSSFSGPTLPSLGAISPTRISVTTSSAPPDAGRAYVYLFTVTPPGVGQRIGGGSLLVSNAGYTGPYFDGSTGDFTADPDMRSRWLGTPNASESVLEGERVAGLVTTTSTAAIVSSREGKPAVRLIPLKSTAITYARFDIAPGPVTGGGLLMGTLHMDAPISGVIWSNSHKMYIGKPDQFSPTAPNEGGTYPLRVDFTTLTTPYQAFFPNGGALGSGDVWWTDIGLFAGDYAGEWFDHTFEDNYLNRYTLQADGSTTWETRKYSDVPNPSIPTTVYNEVYRSIDGGISWQFVEEVPVNGIGFDHTVPIGLENVLYRAISWSDLPSSTESDISAVDTYSNIGYWSAGDSFGQLIQLRINLKNPPKIDMQTGLYQKVLHYFAGRKSPVETTGEATAVKGSAEFVVPTLEELLQARQMATKPAPHLLRLPDTTKVFASIGAVSDTRLDDGWYQITFDITEVSQ